MIALKLAILCTALTAILAQNEGPVEIITEKVFVDGNGYKFDYKTSDGVSRTEEGQLITVGDHQGIGVKGSYSYLAPDGQQYIVSFTADDKGYKPTIRIASNNSQ